MILKAVIYAVMFFASFLFGQCDSTYTYFDELPDNVTIISGDSCLSDVDLAVLDALITMNELDYDSSLEVGTQTWLNGRLKILVAGNYGNSYGVNDTIFVLPDDIGDWSELSSLYLEWNRIPNLPESFSQLSNLQSLYLSNNILGSLGEEFGELTNLYFLDMGYNELDSIPESICQLENLNYLWLFNNNLAAVPDCICSLNIDWNEDDPAWYPYFAIGGNYLCEDLPECIETSEHLHTSLDQFYYSFQVTIPQDCDSTTISTHVDLPVEFEISKAYPNPFNPETSFQITLSNPENVTVVVYNISGDQLDIVLKDELLSSGKHIVKWNGNTYPSGIYFIRVSVKGSAMALKTTLLK